MIAKPGRRGFTVTRRKQCIVLAIVGLVVVLGCAGLGNTTALKYNNSEGYHYPRPRA
jgi:hypothetical protein